MESVGKSMAEVRNIKALRPKRKILEDAKDTLNLTISDEGLVEEIQMTVETGEKTEIEEGFRFHGHILDVILDPDLRLVLDVRKPSAPIDMEQLIADDGNGQIIKLNEAFPDQFMYTEGEPELPDMPVEALDYEERFRAMHMQVRQIDQWRRQLSETESRMDKEVSRYYHEIEQEHFNAARGYKLAKELQKTLRMRRVIKVQRTELESISDDLTSVLSGLERIDRRLQKSNAFGKEMVDEWKKLLNENNHHDE